MRNAIVAALLVSLAWPAAAVDQKDVEKLSEALFTHMAVTYMCRDALGGLAHYQAARQIAIGELSRFVPRDQAVMFVDKQDKANPVTTLKNANASRCMEKINEGLYEIEVLKAKTN